MADRIQLRRDTKANWEQYNPILLEGEPGHVLDYPNLYKMGDGIHTWNQLPYRGYNGNVTQDIQNDENSVPSGAAVYNKFLMSGVNLINTNDSDYVLNKELTSSGGLYDTDPSMNKATTGFIKIDPSKTYTMSYNGVAHGYNMLCYYNVSKIFIGYQVAVNNLTIPNNAVYIRITSSAYTDRDHWQFEEGSVATEFKPYSDVIKPELINIADKSVSERTIADKAVSARTIADKSVSERTIADKVSRPEIG